MNTIPQKNKWKVFNTAKILVLLWLALNISSSVDAQHNVVLDSLSFDISDTTSNRRLTFNGYPYVFFTPETELAFGVGGIFILYTEENKIIFPSKIGVGGYYSTLKQYKISLNPAFYFFENKLFIRTPVSFGFFVDKFWGIGNGTTETGNEQYERQGISASFILQSPPIFFAADRSGLIIDYDNTDIKDKKENVLLQDSTLTGIDGGEIIGIGYDLTWDNRDNIFFPNTGGYQYFKLLIYPEITDFLFAQLELDTKHYWAPAPDHVFAANFYLAAVMGDVPFYKLPALGGPKRMRGYFQGRYRDKFYSMVQVEYRQYFWRKFGFVVFGGLGDVASELIEYDFGSLKYSYGLGLRFLFNKEQKVNLRVDIGFGEDDNRGIYFGIEEAF
ncbi:MAG: BamA/TamA family outer membrane protein [Bacteroidetes bacterium]|nr:BamA/TamA family outer membrane protein [Bacteroidota bacterium]